MGVYDYQARDIKGEQRSLGDYRGKLLLIVNVASKCGLTPQYQGLEALYQKYHAQGLEILGFPCDQFSHQEPGSEAEIAEFCELNYGVSFPLFAKIEVNGEDAHPLYRYLRTQQPGQVDENTPGAERLVSHLKKTYPELLGTDAVKWNFTKFLVAPDGAVIERFEPVVTPEEIERSIAARL
ncbi:MAG: Glutathione peroxidase family protein [Hydrocarboniphaga sp.]|uniref:glutathione peroxidase n=1 Tax=Hydrocarboniphaga sp. TaxID=2033016 RepID=UPI00262066E8|nr:glutathione peroxidase [Hydrocarboniphaga sp.]MDB5970660.1 Glutathione peroxidase family protein [Hydrocarboniphaga sp.]